MNHKYRQAPFSNIRLHIALVLLCWCWGTGSGAAQVVYNDPARINQSFVYLHWNLAGDTTEVSISQWAFPVSGMVPLGDDTELRYYTALSGADASSDLFNRDLSGMTDTRVHVARTLLEDQVLVAAGINLPTGHAKLGGDQLELLRVLSAEKYNFPVKTYGEGLGLYSEILGATETGKWIVGGGAGFYYSGSYQPADDDVSYQSGPRLYLTGSAEINTGENNIDRVKFGAVLVLALADQAGNRDVFRDGILFDLSATGTRRLGQWTTQAQARLIMRGKDQRLAQGGNLAAESYVSTGSEFRFAAEAHHHLSGRWYGNLDFSAKVVTANGYPQDDLLHDGGATLIGFGGGINARLSAAASAAFGLRKWFGNAAESGLTEVLDLQGWEISQHITVLF
jgi:hypothetical protein